MCQKELTCAVAVNLGATKTGVCAFVGSADKPIQRENVHAAIIVTPTDGDGIIFSSASRTMKRHEIRNRTRFGLARRLMNAIVDHLLDVGHQDLHPKKIEAIHDAMASLLRRRGFTYSETDLSVFDHLIPTSLKAIQCLQNSQTLWIHIHSLARTLEQPRMMRTIWTVIVLKKSCNARIFPQSARLNPFSLLKPSQILTWT